MPETNSPSAVTSPTAQRHLILGTAGHIDHGKTSLIRALTGTDTDRLPEEKKRGMTIELGFAELSVGSIHFGVVDVPGHERFVRTMVAGATGIDIALIVVAADDSVMPQTIEHVEILRLVGIEHAVVAITKADLVDETMLELVEEEVHDLLEGTSLANSPAVRVSSTTGLGLDALRTQLADAAGRVAQRSSAGPFRMAIDRVFTVQGRGTVVTGSVIRGLVHAGDTLDVHPGGGSCRVRDVQSHGVAGDHVELGQRAALNLIGVDRTRIDRGHELSSPGLVAPSRRVDAWFEVLSSTKKPIKPFARVRICMGTREVLARVGPLDQKPIDASSAAMVQLRSTEPMFATYGQRFIARTENGARTVGGGVVLRPRADRWSRDRDAEREALETLRSGSPADRLTQVLAECAFDPPAMMDLCARTGILPDELPDMLDAMDVAGDRVALDGVDRRVVPTVLDRLFARADRWLEKFHESHPDEPGCPADALIGWLDRKSDAGLGRTLFERLRSDGRVVIRGQFACLPRFAPAMSAQDERLYSAMLAAFRDGLYTPPSLDRLAGSLDTDLKRLRRLAKIAVSYGELIEIDRTIQLAADHEKDMRRIVAEMIASDGAVTVSQVRERLNSSRKYVVPLLEYLDRIKFTRRDGDRRVLCEGNAT